MKITRIEDAQCRLREGYDPYHFSRLWRLQKFAFGEPLDSINDTNFTSEGILMDFPDVMPSYLQIGKTRRILNHTFISASKILYGLPEPEFVGVPEIVSKVRKEYWRARFREEGVDGDWSNEVALAFLDGDSLGVGVVQVGLVTGNMGEQKVSIQHIPITRFIYDPHVKSLSRCRWCAFVHYIPYDEAEAKFGKQIADKYLRNELSENSTHTIRSMRVVEYFDIGYGDSEPTRILFANDWDGEVLEKGENPFKTLPFAFYQFFTPPGCRRSIGRIFFQMSTQEALNEVEDHMRKTILNGASFDLVDISQLDTQDLETLNSGDSSIKVKYTPGTGSPYIRIPSAEVGGSILNYQSYLERQLSTESGLTDLDRGTLYSSSRTATEINTLNSSSAVQGSWSKKQLVSFYKRIIDKVFEIAHLFDREPLMIQIDNNDFELNNPDDPHSWLEFWLQQSADIEISESTLEYQDDIQKRNNALQALSIITPELQAGLIDPVWYTREKLKILGYEPELAMKQAEAAAQPGNTPQGINNPVLADMAQSMQQNTSAPAEGQ